MKFKIVGFQTAVAVLFSALSVTLAHASAESNGGGDGFALDFENRLLVLADRLTHERGLQSFYGYDMVRLSDAVRNLKVSSVKTPLIQGGKAVDAITYPERNEIVFNSDAYVLLNQSHGQNQFALHQMFSILDAQGELHGAQSREQEDDHFSLELMSILNDSNGGADSIILTDLRGGPGSGGVPSVGNAAVFDLCFEFLQISPPLSKNTTRILHPNVSLSIEGVSSDVVDVEFSNPIELLWSGGSPQGNVSKVCSSIRVKKGPSWTGDYVSARVVAVLNEVHSAPVLFGGPDR